MRLIKTIFSWSLPVFLGLIVAYLIQLFILVPVTVNGDSMMDNLHNGQRIWVFKPAKIRRGSVVVFDARREDPGIQAGEKDYVKRVIAVSGDEIRAENGLIYVNGHQINQNYISFYNRTTGTGDWDLKSLSSAGSLFVSGKSHWIDGNAVKVPNDCYFVLGDNRARSEDSRYFGFIDKKHVVGAALVFPWEKDRTAINSEWKHFYN